MSLIRKHGAVLQAWACLDLVLILLVLFFKFCCCFMQQTRGIPVSDHNQWLLLTLLFNDLQVNQAILIKLLFVSDMYCMFSC